MKKINYDDKINLYSDKKKRISLKSLIIKYNVRTKKAQYLYWLIEKHSFDISRTSNNKKYPKYFKQETIDRIMNQFIRNQEKNQLNTIIL